jgi:nicotinamide-nucleotide amidase
MPSAEIIAIGTEILLGDIVDTNSQALAKALAEFGVEHKRRTALGDHLERCSAEIRDALTRSDVVFTIGGLGPTCDDLTREAIAAAVGEPLVADEDALAELKAYVEERGRPWRDAYERQAQRPRGAVCLPNDSGTAPGIHWQGAGKHVIAMPGPRNEFHSMLESSVRQILASVSDSVIHSRTLRVLGIPEATLGEMFAEEMEGSNPTLSPYAKVGEVHLRLTAKAATLGDAEQILAPTLEVIKEKLGRSIYTDNNADLAQVIIEKLTAAGHTLALAESCTGGAIGQRMTSVPGASRAFVGGVVCYSDRVKADMLKVKPADLTEHGAVSEVVANQMATNVCSLLGSTYGISVTGIAGPGGGSVAKPVGLVYIGVATPSKTHVLENRFRGSREHIREISVQRALSVLYTEIRSL